MKSHQRFDIAPLIIYCLYLVVSAYWGLRLVVSLMWVLTFPNTENRVGIVALFALNLVVFTLVSILAFRTFNGKGGLCFLIFAETFASVGMSWLNFSVPLPGSIL
jgi:riboflavin transporter FmnP